MSIENFVNVSSIDSSNSNNKNNNNINDTEYDENTNINNTDELNVPYTVCEILVAIVAIIGNAMVVIVFLREKKLRRRTNYYIVSLAVADMLVGLLGIPFAILASIGLPKHTTVCLLTISLLVVLCTISIFCLVAVSVDRYWAILYPLAYSKNVRTKTTLVIIAFCWAFGSIIGFLPSFGWNQSKYECESCLFEKVMDYNYLLFLYFGTIITPAVLMIAFYIHIYTIVIKQVTQVVTIDEIGAGGGNLSRKASLAPATLSKIQRASSMPVRSSSSTTTTTTTIQQQQQQQQQKPPSGKMLRVLGAARKREVKAAQNLSIIVFFFLLCWIPLYTINFVNAFCKTCSIPALTYFCIILSHLNSALNPLLYAYHLKDFRAALKYFILKLFGKEIHSPESSYKYSLASHQHRLQSIFEKRMSLQPRVYVDSPVYLRQQETLKKRNSMLITGSSTMNFEHVLQNSTAIGAITNFGGSNGSPNEKKRKPFTSIAPHRLHKTSNPTTDREIWNILEIPSGVTKENSSTILFDDDIKSIAASSSVDIQETININNNNNEFGNDSSEILHSKAFESNDLSFAFVDDVDNNNVNYNNVRIMSNDHIIKCQEPYRKKIAIQNNVIQRNKYGKSNSISQIFHIQSTELNQFCCSDDNQWNYSKNISQKYQCQQSSLSLNNININNYNLKLHIERAGDDGICSKLNQHKHSSTNEMIATSSIKRSIKESRSKSITNFDLSNNEMSNLNNNCFSCELVFNKNINNCNCNNARKLLTSFNELDFIKTSQ